jgi:hypothetical protein
VADVAVAALISIAAPSIGELTGTQINGRWICRPILLGPVSGPLLMFVVDSKCLVDPVM